MLNKRRDVYGQAMRFPTGETYFQDNCGGLAIRDAEGRVVKTIDRLDRETRYEYKPDGSLVRVRMVDGRVFEKLESGCWTLALKSGSFKEVNNEFCVLDDGTLRVAYISASGARWHRDCRLDGSATIVNERGRITMLKADLKVQAKRLYAVLDTLRRERMISAEQHQSMCDAYHALTRRVLLEELTDTQAAQVLFHICRMLENAGASQFGTQVCFALAHELMFFSALPDEADNSDGLSVLIGHLFRHRPEQAAMLVADMSVYRHYNTASGLLIKWVDELMHPVTRRCREWSTPNSGELQKPRFQESNRLLRVVLVNIVEKARIARRAAKENLAMLDEARRAMSTREFGRVLKRELSELFEHVTGDSGQGLDYTSRKEMEKELAGSIEPKSGQNVIEVA